jgi:hypothetical protein
MPYEVQTEAMRVALARQEAADAMAEIERKMFARKRALIAAGANTKAKFIKAAAADEQFRALFFRKVTTEFWRDRCIEDGLVPTITEPGEPIRWRRPGERAS